MSDDELRHKKESLAETAVVESMLSEEQEETGVLCSACGGVLVMVEKETCRDCGAKYK